MATIKTGPGKAAMIGGLFAVVGVVGYVALQYPPLAEETAGTIVPAKRFVGAGAGGANSALPTGDQSGMISTVGDTGAGSGGNAGGNITHGDLGTAEIRSRPQAL